MSEATINMVTNATKTDLDLNILIQTDTQKPRGKNAKLAWADLAERLTEHKVGPKDGAGFSPATFEGDHRKKENLLTRSLFALDVEQIKGGPQPPRPQAVADLLKTKGWAGAVYTTHSHKPNAPRFRVVLPICGPIDLGDETARDVDRGRALGLVEVLGLGDVVDVSKLGAESLFFLPRCPAERKAYALGLVVEGAPLDPHTIEAQPAPTQPKQTGTVQTTPKSQFSGGDEPKGLAAKMADLRRSSAKIDAAFGDGDGDRSAALQTLAASMKAAGWTPEEYAAAVLGHTTSAAGHVLDQADPERALERAWDRTTAEPRKAARDEFPAVPMAGGINMPRHSLKSWCYLLADDAFFRIETGETLTRTVFNVSMKKNTPSVTVTNAAGAQVQRKLSAAETLLDFMGGKQVSSPVYMPSAGATFFSLNGVDHVNLYREESHPLADQNWKAHAAWRVVWAHYVEMLGKDQAVELFTWLAFCVQRSGVKIRHAILLCGLEGDGKSTLEKLMVLVMGETNVGRVAPEDIRSEFTSWMAGRVLSVVDEVRFCGKSRHDALDRMKPAITNDRVNVLGKNKSARDVPNVTNYLAFSNHADALALSAGDRRWAVMRSVFETRADMLAAFDAAHFDELHQTIEAHPEVLRGWLLGWDLSGFDANKAPPVSVHKRDMMVAAKGADQTAVCEAIESGGLGIGADVLTTHHLSTSIRDREGQRLGTSRLSRALVAEGWIQPKVGRFWWAGAACRVYVRRDAKLHEATVANLKKALNATMVDDAQDTPF